MMGQLARMQDYNPDAGFEDTFANRFGAAPLDPFEAAALRQRQFTNRQQGAGAPRAERAMGALAEIARPIVETPGRTMMPNPYPPGSELAHAFEDQRSRAANVWAGERATDMIGTGLVTKPGAATLGSGAILRGKVGGPWEGGIRAYHSSPHDFDRVDFSKLRTGEGANVYGAGHYMAENPAVSGQGGQYWNQFHSRMNGGPEMIAAERLKQAGFDRERALTASAMDIQAATEKLAGIGERMPGRRSAEQVLSRLRWERELLESGQPVGPRTYEMNLRAKPEELLDWDKPMNQQQALVDRVPMLRAAAEKEAYGRALASTQRKRADELWGMAKDPMSAPASFALERLNQSMGPAASEMLRDAGIPGIRYLDEGSRRLPSQADRERAQLFLQDAKTIGDPKAIANAQARIDEWAAKPLPTYNYVGTDPSKLDVLAKYGVAGAAALPVLGALTDQSSYKP